MANRALTNRLISKLVVTFFLILVLVGIAYTFITFYFTQRYFQETTQQLHKNVANHLIDEKFKDLSPFTDSGTVNKALFGDIMHDMMAVNRGIEVYLLDKKGSILYSVVLDHSNPDKPASRVDLEPIVTFIRTKGTEYLLGDDPRCPGKRKIFSAAEFEKDGHQGYIYIVLAGKALDDVTGSLFGSYFMRLGGGAFLATILFAIVVGIVAILYLTKNLREIIQVVQRFKEGDANARVKVTANTDLKILADTYNNMADTIVENIEQIKSVDRLRQELVANISHDLRSPLAVIQGYIETLQIKSDSLNEKQRLDYLETMLNSTKKLNRLVNHLFDYSKLEANQVKPEKEPFFINELASDIYAGFKILTDQRAISMELKIDENIPLVFADIALVERAIQNLLDNALKFTPVGGTISLSISNNPKGIQVTVNDSGPGIPEKDQLYIFDRYIKLRNQQQVTSAGLGLAIVKKIMDLHDSTVKVVSNPSQGTTFQLLFPAYNE